MQKSRRQNVEKVKTIVYYRFITHHYSYGGNYMFTIENFIHGIANVTKSLKASIMIMKPVMTMKNFLPKFH